MTRDFSDYWHFLPLPCGCVIDACDTRCTVDHGEEAYVFCYWCGMTCEVEAFKEWLVNEAPPISLTTQPSLVLSGENMFEVAGSSGDAFLVREYGKLVESSFVLLPRNEVVYLRA